MIEQKIFTLQGRWRCLYLLVTIVLLLSLLSPPLSHGREATDIYGKRVTIPDYPKKVYSTSPPVTYMLYAMDPSILAGLNFFVKEKEKKYIRKNTQKLPILGGWFGKGGAPNREMILKINPEIIITSKNRSAMDNKIEEAMKSMPMPVINLTLDSLHDYPAAFQQLGQILGRKKRGEELARYARETISQMDALASSPALSKRVTVYYGEGGDGLSTECDTSPHAELIGITGGRNVHCCKIRDMFGMERISFEQVMLYDPEVIVVMERPFYEKIFADPLWRRIKAVRDKKVYMIPDKPFNWFDRPPSFMRLLGARWLAHILYPEQYRINIVEETRRFYRLFLGVELTGDEAGRLLRGE